MADITLARATVADVAQIATVHHLTWQAEFAKMLPSEVVKKMSYDFCVSFWKEYFKKGGSGTETYVAKINHQVAGFVAIIKNTKHESEIDKIYVDPNYQGRGIGSALTTYVFKMLKEQGFEKAIVKVYIKNKKAQAFYEKLGGVLVKEADIVDYHSIIKVKVYEFAL